MKIYIVKESGGSYDDHYVVDVKGFLSPDSANAYKTQLEAKQIETFKVAQRVVVWFEKWKKVNPEPKYPDVRFTQEEDQANINILDSHFKEVNEWMGRWEKSYHEYAKLHAFEPQTEWRQMCGHFDHVSFDVVELEVIED